jgi:hypothetical protein
MNQSAATATPNTSDLLTRLADDPQLASALSETVADLVTGGRVGEAGDVLSLLKQINRERIGLRVVAAVQE